MMKGRERRRRSAHERGSALIGALFVVVTVSVLSVAYLQLSLSKNREGKGSIDSKRAFYMAESGLAEAFAAVELGRSGAIGSPEEPARFANGVFWVEAEALASDKILLRSTGLAGGARSSLSVVVDRTALSIPAQGALGLEQVVLREGAVVDGYDSRIGPYDAQGWDPERYAQVASAGSTTSTSLGGTSSTPTEGGQSIGGGSYLVAGARSQGGLLGGLLDTAGGLVERTVDTLLTTTEVTGYTLSELLDLAESFEDQSALPRGGMVVSNGDILLYGPTTAGGRATSVFGDARPGPEGSVVATSRVVISGRTAPGEAALQLPRLRAPALEDQGDRALPAGSSFTVPGEQAAYGSLHARAGATLVLRGPLELVVGELIVEPGAHLRVDAGDGAVRVWVSEYLGLEEDASLEFVSIATERVLFLVTAEEWIDRDGDGTPDSPVVLRADGSFHGILHAPAAELELDAELDFHGALCARRLTLLEGARYHFDQALRDALVPELAVPRIRAWRFVPLPDEPIVRSPLDPLVQLALQGITPPHPEEARKDTWLELQYLCTDGHTHRYRGLASRFLRWGEVATVLSSVQSAAPAGRLEELHDDYLATAFAHFDLSGFFLLP